VLKLSVLVELMTDIVVILLGSCCEIATVFATVLSALVLPLERMAVEVC
jgi:hypothetical protein